MTQIVAIFCLSAAILAGGSLAQEFYDDYEVSVVNKKTSSILEKKEKILNELCNLFVPVRIESDSVL